MDDELDKVQPMLADTLDKEKQFSAYHLDRSTQLREELTGQFKEDSTVSKNSPRIEKRTCYVLSDDSYPFNYH